MIRYESVEHVSEITRLFLAAEYERCLAALALEPPSAHRFLTAARCYERQRRYGEGLAALREGDAFLREGEAAIEAMALAAVLHVGAGDRATSLEYRRRIAATSVRLSSRSRTIVAHTLAACAWMHEDFIEAEALVAGCDPGADYNAAARGAFIRSWIRWSRGKTAEQANLLIETLQLLERAETPDVGLMGRAAYALAAAVREYHLPRASALLARLMPSIPWTSDLRMEHFQTLRLTAWAQALQAGYIVAIRQLQTARDVAPSPYFDLVSRFDRAWVSRIAGERASFEAEALGAADLALSLDWTQPAGEESTALLTGAEMLAGIDPALAERLLALYHEARAHISPAMAVRRDPKVAALADLARAAICAARNDVNGVRKAAKAAFDAYDGLGVTWRAAWCATLLYRAGCGDEWLQIAKANVADYPRSFIAEDIHRFDRQRCHALTSALTARQREIFGLLMGGRSIDDIAGQLVCSRNTVRIHVGAIYRKFGVRNRVELLTQVSA